MAVIVIGDKIDTLTDTFIVEPGAAFSESGTNATDCIGIVVVIGVVVVVVGGSAEVVVGATVVVGGGSIVVVTSIDVVGAIEVVVVCRVVVVVGGGHCCSHSAPPQPPQPGVGSHTSPKLSPSALSCCGLQTVGQLSQTSPIPSLSASAWLGL
jgi:hypothetical protein